MYVLNSRANPPPDRQYYWLLLFVIEKWPLCSMKFESRKNINGKLIRLQVASFSYRMAVNPFFAVRSSSHDADRGRHSIPDRELSVSYRVASFGSRFIRSAAGRFQHGNQRLTAIKRWWLGIEARRLQVTRRCNHCRVIDHDVFAPVRFDPRMRCLRRRGSINAREVVNRTDFALARMLRLPQPDARLPIFAGSSSIHLAFTRQSTGDGAINSLVRQPQGIHRHDADRSR
jgi:hypothetical protein